MNDPYAEYRRYYGLTPPPPVRNDTPKVIAAVAIFVIALAGLGVYLLWNGSTKRAFARGMSDEFITKGNVLYHKHDYNGAISEYSLAIEMDPSKSLGYRRRGDAELFLARYHDAIVDYRNALNTLSTDNHRNGSASTSASETEAKTRATIEYNLGLAYESSDDATDSAAAFTAAMPYYPIDSCRHRAFAYGALRNWPAAFADISTMIHLDPNNPARYADRGELYARHGDLQAAVVDFNHATEMEPGNLYFYQALGDVCERAHNYKAYLACWKRAVSRNPSNAFCWTDLGWGQYLDGQTKASISSSQRAIALDSNCIAARLNLGLCYAVENDWKNAEPVYREAIRHARASDIRAGLDDVRTALTVYPSLPALLKSESLLDQAGRQATGLRAGRPS